MRVAVLGPVGLHTGDRVLPAGPRQQRHVLAALAVDANRLVPVDSLIDRVWGEAPPPGARRTMQIHVARIRRVLAQASTPGTTILVRGGSDGYVLRLDLDLVDLHRFRRLVASARAPDCPPSRQVTLLREAMAVWSGEPLAGLVGSPGRLSRTPVSRQPRLRADSSRQGSPGVR